MDKISVLDKIMADKETMANLNLDFSAIIEKLFSQLNDREKNVLKQRYGLVVPERKTLEEIGQGHSLTRERIRQIELAGVNKIKKLKDLNEVIGDLKKNVTHLLTDHGGLMDKRYLIDQLLQHGRKSTADEEQVLRNYLDFLIAKVLDQDFAEVNNSKYFNRAVKLRYEKIDHLEELATELLAKIKQTQKLFLTEEVITLTKELDSFQKHQAKLVRDITATDDAKADLLEAHKPLYSLLVSLTELEQNKYGYWGHISSREIKPKNINDKIYLILKHEGQPMHYEEIVKKINALGLSAKPVNVATAHNELILDDKYVLVGRGIYGLKEWGYKKGAVSDIIAEVLKAAKEPLSKEEIMTKVLQQRMVKKNTISLALMNKQLFEKVAGKRYKIKA